METTYKTFKRAARNFEEFASAEKIDVDTGLTLAEARQQCEEFKTTRTPPMIEMGLKMEFERE